jgi:outer membrane protein
MSPQSNNYYAPMKKQVIAAAVLCSLVSGAAFAAEQEGPWMVRARAVNLNSANTDSTGLGLTINNKVIPEVDISYFYNKNVAVELILTVPQEHNLESKGTKIGTVEHLPPTLLLQYHFDSNGGAKPYIGAGVNYTRFTRTDILGGAATLDKDSWGGALQVGVDIPLSKGLYLNVDLKKVYIKSNVYVGSTNVGDFKVDPVLFGIGLGWRF